ncbi:site-specific DNA-methyltransferase [Halobacillus salinarum]|uniref:Site-specific DNA-methyltransferase n=1 Tax=Halobacillus salinarum TaxID=2932257 RepID=A0ABY4EFX2_9BACI|nr:site-specific DNA-methyltransferase [Halobacillus salinarum]UOQ43365.1 site-specific DNA-methyltransferase [Halobacillus salinarum]
MNIQSIKTANINPSVYNPRRDLNSKDEEYQKLKKSIQEFGYVDPLVWNKQTGNLVGGHQRFKILLEDDPEEIQVSVVDLPLEKEKTLNIALNKIEGGWDEEKLQVLLQELDDSEMNVEITGFDGEELEEILASVPEDTESTVEEDSFDFHGKIEELKNTEAETQDGDVWQLGRHFLVCGDATKREDVLKLLGERKANLIVTDPPYNVAVKSDAKELKGSGHGSIMNDDMDEDLFEGFLSSVFREYANIMDDKAAIYVFHPSSYQREFEDAMNQHDIEVRSQCIWVKNAPTFGWAQYRYKHEPIFYAFKKGNSPYWYGDRKQTTVWKAGLPVEEPEPESVWEVSRGDVSKYVHPTQKPLELISIPLKNSSKKGDFVVDFFGGSGSTLLACEQLGRDCGLLELDPYFCDAIKKRYEEYTGITPKLLNPRNEE